MDALDEIVGSSIDCLLYSSDVVDSAPSRRPLGLVVSSTPMLTTVDDGAVVTEPDPDALTLGEDIAVATLVEENLL